MTARVDAVAYFRVVDANSAVVERRGRAEGDAADRADHAALRARQGRPRHAAVRARAAQRGPAADHRRADRAVGDQGDDGRDQGRRASPTAMQKAMSRQAEAERERRAGSSTRTPSSRPRRSCAEAAEVISAAPAGLQLRYLQTLREIGAAQNPRRSSSRSRSTSSSRCWSRSTSRQPSTEAPAELHNGAGVGELPKPQ